MTIDEFEEYARLSSFLSLIRGCSIRVRVRGVLRLFCCYCRWAGRMIRIDRMLLVLALLLR